MTDNDEAYEQARADQPADMQAQFDAEPVPAGFDAELDVDPDKVEHLTFSSATPQSKAAILAGRVPPSHVVSVAAVANGDHSATLSCLRISRRSGSTQALVRLVR